MTYAEMLVLLMLKLQPYEPPARLLPIARAIEQATNDRKERAVLLVVDEYETGFGRPNSVPFGLSCCWRRLPVHDLVHAAQRFLAIWHEAGSASQCGERASDAVKLGYYHSGECVADRYSRNEAATLHRIMRSMP